MGLSANGVRTGYSERDVLTNISFSAGQGQMIALLGPNGSGKTTLLRTLSKALSPKAGVIRIENELLDSISAKDLAKRMAVIPQSFETTFAFTVEEIVMMGRSPHVKRQETEEDFAIVRSAMEATNIWHLRDKLITNISGGERQRAIIARALAQEPDVLLLDEPTSSLDITHQIEVLSTIHALARGRNLTVIAAFHDLNLAAKYFDTLILIHNGTIRAMGPPLDVLRSDIIREVYGVDVIVQRHPMSESVFVIPVSSVRKCDAASSFRVHVIGGGGTATQLMHQLSQAGCNMSLGAINILDSDHETAKMLGIRSIALESPFSPISSETYGEACALARTADVVVLSDFKVGSGNLANLEVAMSAIDKGVPVALFEPPSMEERDFTEGAAATKWVNQLKSKGAQSF
jgi:iron complex transport system ATP-binding protein